MAGLRWVMSKRTGVRTARIEWYDKSGKRVTLYAGELNKSDATEIQAMVSKIVEAKKHNGEIPAKVTAWANSLSDDFYGKLSRLKLLVPRSTNTLAGFVQSYIDNKQDISPYTRRNMLATLKELTEYFGKDKPLRAITSGDADDWQQWLMNEGFAEATWSKMIVHAKQFMKSAVRKGLANSNPFQDLKAGSQSNPERLQFIDRAKINKLLDACPSLEWKLLIVLARYGGLRTPSETLALTWNDIDWANNKIMVPSPKGKKHGKPWRPIPIFPELRLYLDRAWEQAPPRTDRVLSGINQSYHKNMRTQLARIIKRAGLEQWPRLFHNLRASRETELANEYPLHVVTSWLGNTPTVAAGHYLSTTDEHFRRATETKPDDNANCHATGSGNSWNQEEAGNITEDSKSEIQEDSIYFNQCTYEPIPPAGFDYNANTPKKQGFLNRDNANCNATRSKLANVVPVDDDLLVVMKLWPSLSVEVREQVKQVIVDAVMTNVTK